MTNTISREDFETAIERVGYESIREDYSGRFMYGAECFGVVLAYSPNSLKASILAYAESIREEVEQMQVDDEVDGAERMSEPEGDEIDDDQYYTDQLELAANLESLAECMCTDNMGLDMIAYFPGWQFAANGESS